MKVTVELRGYLDQYSPGLDDQPVIQYELPDGATALDLVRSLKIPEEMASVIVVNGDATEANRALTEGDRVTLIPPLAGG
jgi:sulfur carrier protein ThiS